MVHPLQNAAAHIPRLLTSAQVGQNHSSTGTLARGGLRHSQWYLSHPNMPCKDTHPYIQHLSCTTTKKLTYQLHTLHLSHTTGKVSQQLQPNVNIQHLNIYKYSRATNMTTAVQHKHAASLTKQGTNLKTAAQYKYTKPVLHNRESWKQP